MIWVFFLLQKNKCVQGSYGVKEVDALSMRELSFKLAKSWLKNTGIGNVDVETDSLLVVNDISGSSFLSAFGLIIDDIKELASIIDDVDFQFVKQSANHAAHTIVKEAVAENDLIHLLFIL